MDTSGHFYPRHDTARMEQDVQPQAEGPGSPPREQDQPPPEAEPHNIRELQLAAQLGQNLASTALFIPGTSGELSLGAGSDPSLRTILPHPPTDPDEAAHQHVPGSGPDGADQVHHYVEAPHPDQMSLEMPMHLEHHHAAVHFSPGEIPPRKRSKVSRACDECRRKKVKCDAQVDVGDAVCSGCRRANIPCLFSRVPQKRGPSKGYIKELADRIGSIEQLVQRPGEDRGTKRSFSTMSAGSVPSTPASSRPPVWGSEPRPLQPTAPQIPEHYRALYTSNDLAPQLESLEVEGTQAGRIPAQAEARPESSSAPGAGEVALEIGQNIFDRYLMTIHPHLPLLDERKDLLESRLGQCPKFLQDAFLETLSVTASSFNLDQPTSGAIDQAYKSLVEWELLPPPASAAQRRAADLTYIQVLLLMAIEADNRPPNTGGPPKEVILGRAVSGALARRLHQFRPKQSVDPNVFPEDGDSLPLRMWWVLVVLDRWHAVSTGSPVLISKRDMIAPPDLKTHLGERLYYLLRFTRILGPASTICSNLQDPPAFPTPNEQELFNVLHTWLEEDREELPPHVTPGGFPLVHLAYWHSRLLVDLLDAETTSAALLTTCKRAVALLVSNPGVPTPFNHHLTILTTLSLLELTAVEPRKEDATSLLNDLRALPIAPSSWNPAAKATAEEKLALLEGGSVQRTARASLQRLADAATARSGEWEGDGEERNLEWSGGPYADLGFNPAPILRLGYVSLMREMHP